MTVTGLRNSSRSIRNQGFTECNSGYTVPVPKRMFQSETEMDNYVEQLTSISKQAKEVRTRRMEANADIEREGVEAKANFVIDQIKRRCLNEAHAGRNHAVIYGLQAGQDYSHLAVRSSRLGSSHLERVGMLVHAALREADLEPTIDFWHDEVKENSGYNLIAHWPE